MKYNKNMTKPILIVEDDPMQRQMLATLLRRKMDYGAQEAENGRIALDILAQDHTNSIKLIILDLEMPVMNGIETLEILKQKYPNIPVVMLTGSKDVENVAKAMKLGAIDFVSKPYDPDRISVTVKNALKISILSKEVSRLTKETQDTFGFQDLIGHDNGLRATISMAQKAAASDIPVLITGETGTGKEVFAKAIHGESARSGKPFIAINCGAIPRELVESTLFGHEKGAFTGAKEKAIGKFREAEGGTIFLDEIGELPLDAQVKLLRVLQQKEVEPVGSAKPISVNIRILSATNRDLKSAVKEHQFREDLYFRLNVLELSLPALRDRAQDIALLAHHFIDRFCASENVMPKTLSKDCEAELANHAWPGNVRQLENAINRAMVISDNNILKPEDFTIPDTAVNSPKNSSSQSAHLRINVHTQNGDFKTAREIEAELIEIALKHFNQNVTKSAKALGIAKSTFYRKVDKTIVI